MEILQKLESTFMEVCSFRLLVHAETCKVAESYSDVVLFLCLTLVVTI